MAKASLTHRAARAFRFSDPYRIYLRRALRLAVTFPAALLIQSQLLGLPQISVLYGLFGCFSLTTMCDFGGPYLSRLIAYVATIGMGWISITIASAASFSFWAAVGATLVYGFLVTYSGVLRGYFAAAVPGVFVGFFLAISTPNDWSQLRGNLIGWTVGAGLAAAGGLLLWPMRTRDLLRRRIADVLETLAEVVDSIWVESDGRGAKWEQAQHALVLALDALRANYTGLARRPGSTTGRQRYLTQLVTVLDDLASTLQRAHPDKAHDLPGDRELAVACAQALRDSAAVCRIRRPRSPEQIPDVERLNQEREWQLTRVERWMRGAVGAEPSQRVVVRVRHDMILRRVSGMTVMALAHVRGSLGLDPQYEGMGTFGGEQLAVRLPNVTTKRNLVLNLTPDSIWFRNSARAAVAFAIAVAVILLTGLDHGFWIALGVMVALQSDATGSRSSVRRVLTGTVIGLIIATVVLWLAHGNPLVLWPLLALSVALATFAPGASTPVAGQTAFTIFLLVLFALLLPGDDRITATTRLADVVIAMAVTLAASMALWPRGAAALVSKSLAEATFATGNYMVVAFRRLSAGPGGFIANELAEADQAARASYERAAENFDLATAQRVPNGIPADVWLRSSGAIVEALLEVDKVKFMADAFAVGEMFPAATTAMGKQAHRISAAWVESICHSCDVEVTDYVEHYEPVGVALHGLTARLNKDAAHAIDTLLTPEHPRLSDDEAATAVALIASVAALSVLEHSGVQVARYARARTAALPDSRKKHATT